MFGRTLVRSTRAVAVFWLLVWTGYGKAAEAPADPGVKHQVVIGAIDLLDDAVTKKGISAAAVSGALQLNLALDPTIGAVALEPIGEIKKPRNGYYLTSALQSFQNRVLWTGALQRFVSRDETSKPDEGPRVLIGPVTLNDENGLRPAAFGEVVTLIKRELLEGTVQAGTLTAHRISCFSTESPRAKRLAEDLTHEIDYALQAGRKVRSMGVEECVDANLFDCHQRLDVGANILINVNDNDGIAVKSELCWIPNRISDSLRLPLPELRERLSFSGLDQKSQVPDVREIKITRDIQNAYVAVLSRTIPAIVNQSRANDVESASRAMTAGPEEMAQVGSALLDAGNSPYVALGLLQRAAAGRPSAIAAFQIGRAYHGLGESASAERYLRLSLQLMAVDSSAIADVQGELGTVLFEQQKFSEAELQLRESLGRKDNPKLFATYLRATYLLGNSDEVLRIVDQLSQQHQTDPEILAIVARVTLDRHEFGISLLNAIKQALSFLPPGNQDAFLDLARTLAIEDISSLQPDAQVAKDALDLVIDRTYLGTDNTFHRPRSSRDAIDFLMRGRAELAIAEGRDFQGISDAVSDMRQAMRFLLEQPPGKRNGDLAVADLELAEVLFLDTDYRGASSIAADFLARAQNENPEVSSYSLVAHLLFVASRFGLDEIQDPLQDLQRRLGTLPSDTPPAINQAVQPPTGPVVQVRIAEWSFKLFDNFVCQKLGGAARATVRQLSDLVQKKINSKAVLEECK
jgi:tetratricopeptide (TPR) repeat protein